MKRKLSLGLAAFMALSSLGLAACADDTRKGNGQAGVLRIASWDEYIDMGGEDSYYSADSRPLYEEFEDWYKQTYGKTIKVEYVALQDNETMYSKIKMGDFYDLLCPSEYMIMKLAAEDYLEPLPESFYDGSVAGNTFAQNLSPYIRDVFEKGTLTKNGREESWAKYAAGYMWGSTGIVYNPEKIDTALTESWKVFASEACARKITAKDNVRDSYFIGLGMCFEEELLAAKAVYERTGDILAYKNTLNEIMNRSSVEDMAKVKKHLIAMRSNLYGLETDEGKAELINGRLDASFQWSGDGVYTLDEAEENGVLLDYSIPLSVSNLWFDGWVMMKNTQNKEAAAAFINFISQQENVVRNMSYIGYTSCMAGDVVFDYVKETYEDAESETPFTYDLSYFFGEGHSFVTDEAQTRRQLFAQYPDESTIDRLVVMNYFDDKTNERANRMWNSIK